MKKKSYLVENMNMNMNARSTGGASDVEWVRDVRIQVSADDITTGVCRSSTRCALAAALRRHLRPGTVLSVGNEIGFAPRGSAVDGRRAFRAPLPPDASDFIDEFDDLGDVPRPERTKRLRPRTLVLQVPVRFLPEESSRG